jgi:hypothetical protein
LISLAVEHFALNDLIALPWILSQMLQRGLTLRKYDRTRLSSLKSVFNMSAIRHQCGG